MTIARSVHIVLSGRCAALRAVAGEERLSESSNDRHDFISQPLHDLLASFEVDAVDERLHDSGPDAALIGTRLHASAFLLLEVDLLSLAALLEDQSLFSRLER